MKRCIVEKDKGYVNIPADRLEREDDVVFVYDGDKLTGMFSLGSITCIYLSEKGDKPC